MLDCWLAPQFQGLVLLHYTDHTTQHYTHQWHIIFLHGGRETQQYLRKPLILCIFCCANES